MATRYEELRLYILTEGETTFTLPAEDAAFNVLGNAAANTITGNASDNVLDGGAGADALAGEAGSDTYVIDDAGDTVTETNVAGIDLVRSRVTFTLATTGTAFVENLTLTGTGNINGIGNNLANVILGNSGANALDGGGASDSLSGAGGVDSLTGGEGNDTLDGGDGIDEMIGGVGNDLYVINDAAEVITEAANAGNDTVSSSVTYSIADKANLENVILTGTGALTATGNAGNNGLTGNGGANTLVGGEGNDSLDGGAGADRLDGGAGNDTYTVDNTGDTIVDASGNDTVIASLASYTLGAGLENAQAALGAGAIRLAGNNLANVLTGNAGANLLNGGGGVDTMAGGAGNDSYVVDNALDLIIETARDGVDTLTTSVNYALAAAAQVETLVARSGSAALNLTGSQSNNTLVGNSGRNVLSGLNGNDVLDGNLGRDDLRGGLGRDIFKFDARLGSANVDQVLDFNVRADLVYLDNAIFRKLGSGSESSPRKLNKAFFRVGTEAEDQNDYLIYNPTTDDLFYDADGSGSGRAIKIADFNNVSLRFDHFFVI
jgi:Ca2+-binding RTX toxin-like protein